MKLIIINGLPGTGKTTLAKPLAAELNMPLIAKDTIKEFLFDLLGVKDRAWSSTLGRVSSDFLYGLADVMLTTQGLYLNPSNEALGQTEILHFH